MIRWPKAFHVLLFTTLTLAVMGSSIEARSSLKRPEGRAVWSNCRGKRLDTLKLDGYISASECVEMGGDCCGVNDDGMGNGSDDPNVLEPTKKCNTCYDSKVKVKCSGSVVRSRSALLQDWWVDANNCIKAGGSCCLGTPTATNPAVFDPNEFPAAEFCINCYSGPMSNTTRRPTCTGNVLMNNDYTAKSCIYFGGTCCDDDQYIGGSAFKASTFPDVKCHSCFKGEPTEM